MMTVSTFSVYSLTLREGYILQQHLVNNYIILMIEISCTSLISSRNKVRYHLKQFLPSLCNTGRGSRQVVKAWSCFQVHSEPTEVHGITAKQK